MIELEDIIVKKHLEALLQETGYEDAVLVVGKGTEGTNYSATCFTFCSLSREKTVELLEVVAEDLAINGQENIFVFDDDELNVN